MERRVLSYPQCQFCTEDYARLETKSLNTSDYSILPHCANSFRWRDNLLRLIKYWK
jgi:hypothetical protein